MDKILVTGAAGFIGSHLIDYCIKKEFEIYALDRPNVSMRNLMHYTNNKEYFLKKDKNKIFGEKIKISSNKPNLSFIECDLKNSKLLEKIISNLRPKFIFHFGAQPYILPSWEDPRNTIEINVIGTINIFEPLKNYKIDAKVIFAGTSAEFGSTANIGRPLKEDDPLLAIHPYGISKLASELLGRQYFLNFGVKTLNLRFFNLTGTRRVNDAASDFIRKIAQINLDLAEPVIEVGNLEPYRDILDVEDAVAGIWLVATKGRPGEVYHICSGKKVQIRELLKIALSLTEKKIEVIENVPEKLRTTDEDIIIGDNSKATSELGWKVTKNLKETLTDMFNYWIDYYQSNL
ncbi:MAG: GDP-mannose 4,6-dehydratase [Promethearchaeota archaeon]